MWEKTQYNFYREQDTTAISDCLEDLYLISNPQVWKYRCLSYTVQIGRETEIDREREWLTQNVTSIFIKHLFFFFF
jgi:hypothetical protein